MTKNELVQQQQPKKFSVEIQSDAYKKLINNTLGDPDRAKRFVTAISSAVANNPALQECHPATILTGALLGEALNLSPSPQLGYYYLVPFNDTKKGYKVAQFQMGYKGYIQLAMKAGIYRKLIAIPVKKGELKKFDPYTEEIEFEPIEDDIARDEAETIGYFAMFETTSGFIKKIYWSKPKMEKHALNYSKGYKAKKGYTFWEKDFDEMGNKTMLRQLLSKWGMLSAEIEEAYQKDMSVIDMNGNYEYVDNIEDDELQEQIAETQTVNLENL